MRGCVSKSERTVVGFSVVKYKVKQGIILLHIGVQKWLYTSTELYFTASSVHI